jgi:spermidine synthase
LILFLGSGCSALIYEVVWFQLLEFAVGSSAYSIGVLLGTFMGGLCLGSLLFSRLVPRTWHPLRTYACLELGIGVLGILITWGMPGFDRFYALIAHGTGSGIPFRALLAMICLLPPTLLMGATLPAISRWIETTPTGVSWLGFFYGGNTVGAVVGCLLAGFFLLPNYSMATATYIAAGINLAVAVFGVIISMGAPYQVPEVSGKSGGEMMTPLQKLNDGSIYVAIAFSGFSALGAEVIWTRLLSLLLGATVYTFSIILAVFLVGLGAGSTIGAMMTRSGVNARSALAWCQIACAAAIGWAAYAVTNGVSSWPVDTSISTGHWYDFQLDLARCAWAILLPTLFWGASFPLALAAVVGVAGGGAKVDPARAVGRVYAANTVGAILGALFFSLIAIKTWGTQTSQHLLVYGAALAAVCAIFPALIMTGDMNDKQKVRSLLSAAFTLIAGFGVPIFCTGILAGEGLDEVPWKLIAWGRALHLPDNQYNKLEEMGEGMNSSVAVTKDGNGEHYFHVAGKVEASTLAQDMRLQLMLGHYPSLFHTEPKKDKRVLIVGCGAGVTAGTFMLHPHAQITICELEPLVPQLSSRYFSPQNNGVVDRDKDGKLDEKVRIIFDDARHFVLTTDEKFDIITSDPIHPWVKGAASLYTKEYFETVKSHLEKGGLVTQWVPLYESDTEVVKSEIATFFEVFPNGTIWCNDVGGSGYDVILLGGEEPLKIDAAVLADRLKNTLVAGALKPVGLDHAEDILRTYGGRASDLKEWTRNAQINHDANLRLQYLAGRALNNYLAGQIQSEILKYRRYPDDMFVLNADQKQMFMDAWGKKGK